MLLCLAAMAGSSASAFSAMSIVSSPSTRWTRPSVLPSYQTLNMVDPKNEEGTIPITPEGVIVAEDVVNGILGSRSGIQEVVVDDDNQASLKIRRSISDLSQAALIGVATGLAVAVFKLSIEATRVFFYEQSILQTNPLLVVAIPLIGGALVGLLMLLGDFPSGLRGTVEEVDQESSGAVRRTASTRLNDQFSFIRKSAASVVTLGTGCSLGPEGPCVELGMNVARNCMDVNIRTDSGSDRIGWNRLLLACGAASGVAAGFNAPITGVFFALEIMQEAFNAVDTGCPTANLNQGIASSTARIAPVLLSSVLSAIVARYILGEHLALEVSAPILFQAPLVEFPLYILLGVLSGAVAFSFSQLAKMSQSFFAGNIGPDSLRATIKSVPAPTKPIIGGLVCGLVGLAFPQILFFGYGILNPLLGNNIMPTELLITLLAAKTFATAVAAGSGLVGGTFAPSLFLGAMTGAAFHNVMCVSITGFTDFFGIPFSDIAPVPAYALIGAGSVLAALFRAPLTGCLLIFEVARDYDIILPLMASAAVGSLFGDILDAKIERVKLRKRRDQDAVSWGDLSSKSKPEMPPPPPS